jgi:hypothetical protein
MWGTVIRKRKIHQSILMQIDGKYTRQCSLVNI